MKPSKLGCVLLATLIVLIALGGYGIFESAPPKTLRDHLPQDAILYLETDNLAALEDCAAALPLWQENHTRDVRYYWQGRLSSITALLFEPAGANLDNTLAPLPAHTAAAIALLEIGDAASGTVDASAVLMVRTNNEKAARAFLEICKEQYRLPQITKHESTDTANPRDRAGLHVFRIDSWIVITPSAEVKTYMEQQGHRNDTLAALRLPPTGERGIQLTGICDPARLRKYRPALQLPLLPTTDADETITDSLAANARIVFSLQAKKNDAFALHVHARAAEAAAPSGTGGVWNIFAWMAYTVLAVIGLAGGILGLLIAAVLLLAGYFWLTQWWNGTLSPPEPPREPELSPELLEDLHANPLRFSNKHRKEDALCMSGAVGEDPEDGTTPEGEDNDS